VDLINEEHLEDTSSDGQKTPNNYDNIEPNKGA